MSDYLNISDFLSPVSLDEISHSEEYKDGQLGNVILIHDQQFPDLDEVQVVIVGCGEQRGSGLIHGQSTAPDIIRRHFYS
ncbi:MAG: arginase, partial [Bacteroidia bacterium]|nr:arginase [Bacteroidia bacterium]